MTTKHLRKRTEQEWLNIISQHTWNNPKLFHRVLAIVRWDYVEYLKPAETMKRMLDITYGRLAGEELDRAVDVPEADVERALIKCGYQPEIAHERARIKTWQTEKRAKAKLARAGQPERRGRPRKEQKTDELGVIDCV